MKKNFVKTYFKKSGNLIISLAAEEKKIQYIVQNIRNCIKKNKKILIAGNGGSSSDSDHFAGELICTYKNRFRRSIYLVNAPFSQSLKLYNFRRL